MSSPFTFFRRNQTVMMAAVVILSMLAFTLSDMFTQQQGTNFLLLGVMIGGISFAFSGLSNGRWIQYGIAGAVLGGVFGWLMPNFITPSGNTVITTKLGTFDNKRISDLLLKRNIANVFLQQAFDRAFFPGASRSAPQFGYFPDNVQDDMTFGELLRAEADEMGIAVTDVMVSDYINKQTSERLTAKAFAESRTALNFGTGSITEDQLFEAFRHEIKAQLAYMQLNPYYAAMPQSPDVYYDLFKRMKVTQRLNIVRLDVDAFVPKVPDPSDAEIAAFFQEHRLKFPNMDGPGSPGFRQLPKAKLAYAEVTYKDIEASMTPPTDEEVEAYYNEKKDLLYQKRAESTDADEATAPETTTPETTTPETTTPETTTPETTTPETTTPETTTPEGESPADASAPVEGATPVEESSQTDEPATTEEPVKTEGSPVEQPEADAGADQCFPFQEETPVSTDPAPAASQESSEATPAETPPADAQTPVSTDETPVSADVTPAAEVDPLTIPSTDEGAAATTPAEETQLEFVMPKIEYIPLDDTLKSDIRDSLLDEKVRSAIDERLQAVAGDLKILQSERSTARRKIVAAKQDITETELYEQIRANNKAMLEGMAASAKKHGCKFVETPLVTIRELMEGETYRVGGATDPSSNPFQPAGPNVAQQVNQLFPENITNDTNLFQQRRSVRNAEELDGSESHYVWWIVEFAEPHVAKLDDEGIRDQVILEWKRIKARDLAKKRGEELAALVKEGLSKPEGERRSFAATLEGQTVAGDADSAVVAVRQSQTFSWIEQSITPMMNFQQQRPELRMGEIRFADEAGGLVRGAGDKFMKGVFETLANEECGVVSSSDQSIFYVVQPLDRSANEEVLRQQFLTEGKQIATRAGGNVTALAREMIGTTISREWTQAIWDKYDVDRGFDLGE